VQYSWSVSSLLVNSSGDLELGFVHNGNTTTIYFDDFTGIVT
jgi:hypothetical protein